MAERAIGASQFLPDDRSNLGSLAAASRNCRGCDLYRHATQTVFGEGASNPHLMLVGEAPGDKEDIDGSPFVGPAGALLRGALEDAGIEVSQTYFTNAVKHFKFERRGDRKVRLHKSPSSAEVVACRPWLLAELEAIKPRSVVVLGGTAGRSLIGASFRVKSDRGRVMELEGLPQLVATFHPSAVLRAPDAREQEHLRSMLVADLALAVSLR